MFDAARHRRDEEAKAFTQARLKAEAIAVRELPPGVQQEWERYVDEVFKQAIRIEGGSLKVDSPLGPSYVSLNTPYQVSCTGGWIRVIFGNGQEAPSVDIVGGLAFEDGRSKEPALGVDVESIAARQLDDLLCARVSRRMNELVGAG